MAPHAEAPNNPTTPQLNPSTRPSRPHQKPNSTSKTPFQTISSTLTFPNPSHAFWWAKTGSQLATLLTHAGYSQSDQYNELLFYALHIIPSLGPAPSPTTGLLPWKSPQTPDGTPLDLSWEWGLNGKGVIRTSFEPIGPLAGTPADPFNSEETDNWIRHLDTQGLVAGLDLEWYTHFRTHVLPSALDRRRVEMDDKLNFELAPVAGTFVTRDVDLVKGPIVKMYIFPGLRAQQLGVTNLDVVDAAIRKLPKEQYDAMSPGPLLEYLREAAGKWRMDVGIFSFDLVEPGSSRIKIYTRAPHTTVEYLMDALTLGGRYSLSMYSEEAIADLKDFWRIFIGDDAPGVLPGGGKERAGPGFYFTVKAGKPATPKVYISPASFCESDAEVVRRLRRYFESRRDKGKMLGQMERYERALEEIYGSEFLESQCDIHFYVSCALQLNQLRVVTYLCPQTLSRENQARKKRLLEARSVEGIVEEV
ncbi:aromatic prenyltransferase [Periconia macrospinosa]|uniref:Aromatic prenyltransferase n=1 Tax=Periconia macrospinosa TaxID=97972 RepID=A0A2V1DE09_9PLEO|nr:aromatic prenyltransferase [Periconia macrospinosa]